MDSFSMMNSQRWKMQTFFSNSQAILKTQGCLGIGGNFHCKIVWNSDPMLRGFGILAYLPPGVDDFVESANVTGQFENGMYLSGCPHVYVNLALDSSVELAVPYVGETVFIPGVDTYQRQLGSFKFYPIVVPTGAAGDVSVQARMYMRMSSVTTFGNHADVPVFQMELEPVVEAVKKSKVVSSTAGSISAWLNKNKDDSVLGSVTRTAGWMMGGISKIADLMGWSKPVNVLNPQPIIHINNIDMVTGDGTYTGLKYAQNADAGISRIALSDNGKDQMLISNFVRENEFLPYHFRWEKDNEVSKQMLKFEHTPSLWYITRQIGNRTQYTFNHLSLLGTMFSYWRGALDLTIHPVMTKFHSGRLRVVYTPEKPVDNQVLLDHMSYTYTWIIDLSDPSTWTIRLPFVSATPWKRYDENAGDLKFFVETELHASAGVSTAIDVFFSVTLTDEFEVAVPDTLATDKTKYIPSILYQAPSATLQMEEEPIKFVSEKSESTGAHQLAIGDPVRSLRAVLKRFYPAFRIPAANTNSHTVNPYAVTMAPWTDVDKNGLYDPDLLTIYGLCFAFSRGGMRYATNGYGTKTVAFMHAQAAGARNGVEYFQSSAPGALDECHQTFHAGLDEPLKIELPWYSRFIAKNNFQIPSDNHLMYNSSARITFSNNATPITLSRAAADDFDMQFLVGAPPFYSYPQDRKSVV